MTPLVIYRMSQSFKTLKTENYFSEGDIIMAEQLNDVIILLDHDMSREDIKSSYDIVKKYGIRFKDIQIKDRRKLVKVVLESKLKEMKKINTIMKLEKKESGNLLYTCACACNPYLQYYFVHYCGFSLSLECARARNPHLHFFRLWSICQDACTCHLQACKAL